MCKWVSEGGLGQLVQKKKYEEVQSAKNIGVYVKKFNFEGW